MKEKKIDIRDFAKDFARCRICDLLLDLIFPRRCPFCDGLVSYGEFICKQCRRRIPYIGKDYCLKCGKPLADKGKEYCKDCSNTEHIFTRGRSLYVYGGRARESISRFKFHGRREYADYYGRDIAAHLGSFIKKCHPDILIPVPVSWEKLRKRGYNQAELIADSISDCINVPTIKTAVVRVKNTPPMKDLTRIQRMKNLEGAFKINVHDVKCRNVLIVDDIYTTGSTIDAVASELKKAGAKEVFFVTLASGLSA